MKTPRYDDDYDRQEQEYYSSPYERELAALAQEALQSTGGKTVHIGQAANVVLATIENADAVSPSCESPIEVQLAARLMVDLKPPFRLEPQYWLGRFRMDFAIMRDGLPCLFIECDGKAFHSSEEQIANDLAKDRAAARAGVPMLRFTGSRIFWHRDDCAKQIMGLLEGLA